MICIIAGAASLFPLLWMAVAGFKTKSEVLSVPLKFFPTVWTTENFDKIFNDKAAPFMNALLMTFLVSACAVVLCLFINMMAAYVFARMNFRFKKLFWAYCILTMYVPGMTIMLTSFLVVSSLGMLDTFWVLVLPGVVSGYSIFFFRQFFLNLPNSLEEAALIDGAGRFRIFVSIFIPMSKAPMVVMGAGTFIGYWNSFLWPSITISSPQYMQIMQVIRSMRSLYSTNFGAIMAATSIAVIPPIILFFIFQKYIVKGFVLSGLK